MSRFLYIGDHAATLHSGARLNPGDDPVAGSRVTPDEEPDRSLILDGVLFPTGGFDVAGSTVDAVLEWVGDNDQRRAEALAVEQARGDAARKSLTAQLTKETD